MALATRAQLRRGLLRLVGTEADDPELTLRGESLNEVLDEHLESGLWNAQRYLVDIGAGDEWLESATLTFGAADDTGARSADAPSDFLRFAGDAENSALHRSSGIPWGRLLRDLRKRRRVTGDWYYFAEGRIWVTDQANVPDGVRLDYYEKLALPEGEAEVAMPEEVRPLITAEAAYLAMHEYWIPTHDMQALENRIARNRIHRRTEAAQALRRADGRQALHDPDTTGSHWFMT